ncbi:RTA1 like protein-domain-containing protein [Leucosporidium creatinivorum]|uniref:RTA1 like protein-domain-containing protein n=1 Tax=Leucosporidium creatinivorum TaxID=106004 RepID=A0A1Y2EUX8_9BASI|nr:RTA1 like protein-domain-containing protein [Leucosporidium creatinivorum]
MSDAYTPNKSLAVAAAVLFGIPTLIHFGFIFINYAVDWRTRSLRRLPTRAWFMIPFFIGVALELIGYITRNLSADEVGPNSTRTSGASASLILTTIGIVVAPAFMSASLYMLFGRICKLMEEASSVPHRLSFIAIRFVTFVFVSFDVVSIVVQILGGVMTISDNPKTVKNSFTVLKVAYIIQVVGLVFFMTLALIARYRAKKYDIIPASLVAQWKGCLTLLYLGGSIITFRSIYRFLEIVIQIDGKHPLADHEALFYIFDTLLMLLVSYYFVAFYPTQYLLPPSVEPQYKMTEA